MPRRSGVILRLSIVPALAAHSLSASPTSAWGGRSPKGESFSSSAFASASCHTHGAVTRDDFEASVMQLWVTTAIPLTRANLQYHSGESSRRAKHWLKELMADGVLEVASNPDGDLEWTVVGAKRAADGPRTFDEKERLERLKNEVAVDLERNQAANAARRGSCTPREIELPQ